MAEASARVRSYANWIDSHRWAVLSAAMAVAIGGGALSSTLPLRPDLSNLLPPSAESVRHLRALESRARTFGSVFVVVESADPDLRERAARATHARLEKLPADLIDGVAYDDGPVRRYFWEHRFLFAPLDDLREARDALADKIRREKLKSNPLYIDLDDEPAADLDDRVASLRERLEKAEADVEAPSGFISEDGELQLLVVRTRFGSTEFTRSSRLIALIEAAMAEVGRDLGAELQFGLTGNVVKSLDEHNAVVRGMTTAAVVTVLICALALLLFYRSVLPVMASLCSLAVGTLATFGFTKLAIGHLNLITAFLAAIVVGNGVNAGLILLARYTEEIRADRRGNDALARALSGAARGTLAASLAAAVAYGSLVVTDFRGFRHFGIIGFVGMGLCWLSAFTVLPAGLAVLWRGGRIRRTRAPALGAIIASLLPRKLGVVIAAGAVITVVSGLATWQFVASNPLQKDWSNLRPRGGETRAAIDWSRKLRERFVTKFQRGLSQRFVIGLDRREQAGPVVAMLRAVDDGAAEGTELLSSVTSLDELVPAGQTEKLELLGEIRELLDDDLVEAFTEDDRELIERVRPPRDIARIGDGDVPEEIAWPFMEKDGTRGRLVLVTSSLRFKTWNVFHRMEFARDFRELELPEGAVVGGQSFIFADMVEAMGRDGPRATLVALLGAVFAIALVVGIRLHGIVTLACAVVGILGMIALVSAAGLEVNVIDFIALPITIGLGIDYAVNIAARERQDGELGPRHVLFTTGGAVLLCSFTTIVGYGSLLISASGGIRSFGLAAMLGEVACVLAALILAPALLSIARGRAA